MPGSVVSRFAIAGTCVGRRVVDGEDEDRDDEDKKCTGTRSATAEITRDNSDK